MFKKEYLALVPVASFLVGYAYLFGLLFPLGGEAMSTITYVDVVDAMIANLFLLFPTVFFAGGFFTSGIKLSELKRLRVVIVILVLLVAACLELYFASFYVATTVLCIIAVAAVVRYFYDTAERPFWVVAFTLVLTMSFFSFLAGSNRISYVANQSKPSLVELGEAYSYGFVYSLDRNVLVMDLKTKKLRLYPQTSRKFYEFNR